MRKRKYKYQVGEVVNDTLKIVAQTTKGKKNEKAYEVQSLVYLDAPTYITLEYSLTSGIGCAYKHGNRIYEGNSLYNEDWARPYLVDIEQAKTLAPFCNKNVLFKCPNCGKEKYLKPSNILHQGFSCPQCSKGTSYPELFMLSYFEVKGIEFEYQYKFNDLTNRVFDFYLPKQNILVETHGEQHFYKNKSSIWKDSYEKSNQSDEEKRVYSRSKGIILVELDCRKSTFEFISNQINNSILPNIEFNEIDSITKLIQENRRYDVKGIISKYKKGMSINGIAKEYKLSGTTISSILRKNNVDILKSTVALRRYYGKREKISYRDLYDVEGIIKLYNKNKTLKEIAEYYNLSRQTITRVLKSEGVKLNSKTKRKVKCITTNKIYDSISEASKEINESMKHLSYCLRSRNGIYIDRVTGKELRWEYIDNE